MHGCLQAAFQPINGMPVTGAFLHPFGCFLQPLSLACCFSVVSLLTGRGTLHHDTCKMFHAVYTEISAL
jgi:hypothetical protein